MSKSIAILLVSLVAISSSQSLYPQLSCGTNTFCFSGPIDPSYFTETSKTIPIADGEPDTATSISYKIQFTIGDDAPCVNPSITFSYEQIDVGGSSEYISLYDDSNSLIQQCQGNGGDDTQCGVHWTCLTNKALDIDTIPSGTTYTITVKAAEKNDALCPASIKPHIFPVPIKWWINAELVFKCDKGMTICMNYSVVMYIQWTISYTAPIPSVYSSLSCGDNEYCLSGPINPSYFVSTSKTLNIIDVAPYPKADVSYRIAFTIGDDADCVDPTITFSYEQIGTNGANEFIAIYDDSDSLIKKCDGNGGGSKQCGVDWTCLSDETFGVDKILAGSTYTITVLSSNQNDALCPATTKPSIFSMPLQWWINSQLTLSCAKGTSMCLYIVSILFLCTIYTGDW